MDLIATRAAIRHLSTQEQSGGDVAARERALLRARAWVDRTGDPESAPVRLETIYGVRATKHADHKAAVGHFRQSEKFAREAYGEAGLMVLEAQMNQMFTLSYLGNYDEAIRIGKRAVDVGARAYGEADMVAMLLDNYALNLAQVGRYAEARSALERGLAIKSAAPVTRSALTCDLARVLVGEGRFDDAIAQGEKGTALFKSLGVEGFFLAINQDPLASAYLGAKRYADALATSRSCLAEFRKETTDDRVDMVPCLVIEGTALVEIGKGRDALASLERAVALQTGKPAGPGVVGNLQFQLARALVASGGDRARARELATKAREEMARYPFKSTLRDEIDAWLANRN